MAKKHLQGRWVFLHTDGARSYKIGINRKDRLDGVVHDYVVHKLRKSKNGKKMRARYVQLFAHQIDGKTVYTKGGTQIIDRCWRHIRKHIGTRSASVSGAMLYNARVRSAQWCFWHMGQDLWAKTGEMFKAML